MRQTSFTERDTDWIIRNRAIARRNILNRVAWEKRYQAFMQPKGWVKWEGGDFYDKPAKLRSIGAL